MASQRQWMEQMIKLMQAQQMAASAYVRSQNLIKFSK